MSIAAANLVAILAMAIGTYATRVAGLLFVRYVPETGRARAALDALPAAVLVAVIAPAATAGPAEIVATAVTMFAVTRLPLLAAVVVGVVAVSLLRLTIG
jgi:uncharacterized membrane protein